VLSRIVIEAIDAGSRLTKSDGSQLVEQPGIIRKGVPPVA
jgi:hypothetical protein